MKSTIRVYEHQTEDRVYEATTDERVSLYGVPAKQLSGPKLDISVSELRMNFWGGGGKRPEHPSRMHSVQHQPTEGESPKRMRELRTSAEVAIFKKYGEPGDVRYFIPTTGTICD